MTMAITIAHENNTNNPILSIDAIVVLRPATHQHLPVYTHGIVWKIVFNDQRNVDFIVCNIIWCS